MLAAEALASRLFGLDIGIFFNSEETRKLVHPYAIRLSANQSNPSVRFIQDLLSSIKKCLNSHFPSKISKIIKNCVHRKMSKSWIQPASRPLPQLFLHNSLTKQKTLFVPSKGNFVSWYVCGPTVYDKSHLGHARAYITFDIIRRILADFFKFDVLLVMNITDIDDKVDCNLT